MFFVASFRSLDHCSGPPTPPINQPKNQTKRQAKSGTRNPAVNFSSTCRPKLAALLVPPKRRPKEAMDPPKSSYVHVSLMDTWIFESMDFWIYGYVYVYVCLHVFVCIP